jgi:tRNA 2-thiouridine synthesizing protein A
MRGGEFVTKREGNDLTPGDVPVRSVDTLGLLCPLPILRAAEAMRSIGAGDVIEILSDDSGILVDLPEWCDETGHRLIEIVPLEKHWRALVRKRPGA